MGKKNEVKPQKGTPWFLYIIKASDGSLYTGITTDVQRRFEEHKTSRGAKYFRGRAPVAVCYVETCVDRSSASRREYEVKLMSAAKKRELVATAEDVKGH